MQATAASLPLAIREILDKISSEDSFFPTETPDINLPGPSTPESRALEESIRNLVARFQDLEQKSLSPPVDARPLTKQVQNVKEAGKDENKKAGVCMSCGHRLETVPLTPEETPVVDMSGPCAPRVSVPSGPCCRTLLICEDGYESSSSDTTTASTNPPDYSVV